MRIALIAALAENRVIGRNNALPWRLPEDLKHFKSLTIGHCVLMGHRTYTSIGRPLPERTNIVLSRDPATAYEGVTVAPNLDAGLAIAQKAGHETIFVIGGEAVYAAILPVADTLYLTRVHAEIEGDAYFPEFADSGKTPNSWQRIHATAHAADERHPYAFTFEQWKRV
jgi:dihydrofolate reductase